jgi:hypothetical protein
MCGASAPAGALLALPGLTAAAGPVRGREQGGPLHTEEIPVRGVGFWSAPCARLPVRRGAPSEALS